MKKLIGSLLTSKKFLAFIVGIILTALSKKGIVIPEDMVQEVVILTASYIGGQGIADMGKEKAKEENKPA